MPRDESQILFLLTDEQQPSTQARFFSQDHHEPSETSPGNQVSGGTTHSISLFDGEHGGYYALPYTNTIRWPTTHRSDGGTVGFAAQNSVSASAAPNTQTPHGQPQLKPTSDWDNRDDLQHRVPKTHFQHAKTRDTSAHESEDHGDASGWDQFIGHPSRASHDDSPLHPTQHSFFAMNLPAPKQPHASLWGRQQHSLPNMTYSFARPASVTHTSTNSSPFHHLQQTGLLQRPQMSASSSSSTTTTTTTTVPPSVSPQSESDSDSPEPLSPFLSMSSPFSTVDFALGATASNYKRGKDCDDTRETTSPSSVIYVPDSGHLGALDSYELMARLTTRLAVMSPRSSDLNSPTNANNNNNNDPVHDNLRRALSPTDTTHQQKQRHSNRDNIGRMMHQIGPFVPMPQQHQSYLRTAPGAALLQPFIRPADGINANMQRSCASPPVMDSTHTIDPDRLARQMQNSHGHFVVYEVEFKRNVLQFASGPGVEDLTIGEFVFVEADRGEHLGQVHRILFLNSPPMIKSSPNTCTCPGGLCTSSECDSTGQYRNHTGSHTVAGRVLRRATMKDVQKITAKSKEETKATLICNQKAKEYVLEMEVVDAEFQFDMKKLTFFYKAQQRVDFRELVRDLYKLYRARIWMQKVEDMVLV